MTEQFRHNPTYRTPDLPKTDDKPWWKYSIIALLIGIIIGSLITQALEVFFP